MSEKQIIWLKSELPRHKITDFLKICSGVAHSYCRKNKFSIVDTDQRQVHTYKVDERCRRLLEVKSSYYGHDKHLKILLKLQDTENIVFLVSDEKNLIEKLTADIDVAIIGIYVTNNFESLIDLEGNTTCCLVRVKDVMQKHPASTMKIDWFFK